jgi:hypothetical protein
LAGRIRGLPGHSCRHLDVLWMDILVSVLGGTTLLAWGWTRLLKRMWVARMRADLESGDSCFSYARHWFEKRFSVTRPSQTHQAG